MPSAICSPPNDAVHVTGTVPAGGAGVDPSVVCTDFVTSNVPTRAVAVLVTTMSAVPVPTVMLSGAIVGEPHS